jgi:hypothetical protein
MSLRYTCNHATAPRGGLRVAATPGWARHGHGLVDLPLVPSHVYTSSNRRISPKVLCSEAQERVLGRNPALGGSWHRQRCLDLEELRTGFPAACTLRQCSEQPPPVPNTGSTEMPLPDAPERISSHAMKGK